MTVLSGATWLVWRNNRQAAVIGGVLAFAAAAALVVVAILESAEPTGSVHTMSTAFQAVLIGAPAVAGVFVGAPLLSADFERGTHLLTWTQGMTRRRWAAANLSLLIALSAFAAAFMAAGAQIWITHLPSTFDSTWGIYDVQSPVFFSYVLFAVSLGAAAGAALRRTVPAMAATLGIFIAVRVAFVELARPHLLPTITRVLIGGTGANSVVPPGAGYVDATFLDSHLRPLSPESLVGPSTPVRLVYQPAAHFWPIQGIEAGIFVILAAALLVAALKFATRDA
ncbi:MAG: hypothetical protein ACHQ4F_03710 [Candidatus Dormibacteria bacterium]